MVPPATSGIEDPPRHATPQPAERVARSRLCVGRQWPRHALWPDEEAKLCAVIAISEYGTAHCAWRVQRRAASGHRANILVQAEEVLWIVFRLDLLQPAVVRPVGRDHLVAGLIVSQIVHVTA